MLRSTRGAKLVPFSERLSEQGTDDREQGAVSNEQGTATLAGRSEQ